MFLKFKIYFKYNTGVLNSVFKNASIFEILPMSKHAIKKPMMADIIQLKL